MYPRKPPTDGDENQKKAYQLWLLASKINERLNFVTNANRFSNVERLTFASIYVLWEMMEYELLTQHFKEVSFHFLNFISYEVAVTRSNLIFRIKPTGYHEMLEARDTEREFDRVLNAIDPVDVFIKNRIEVYSRQLDLFYGPGEAFVPHLAAFLIYKAPLKNPPEIDPSLDYWKLNDPKVIKLFLNKLEGFHEVIKKHLDPILLS